jgi:hypothetical protein
LLALEAIVTSHSWRSEFDLLLGWLETALPQLNYVVLDILRLWSFLQPNTAPIIPVDQRTIGMEYHLIERTVGLLSIQYHVYDYAGDSLFQMNQVHYLSIPHSIYVVVLPLVEKSDDDPQYQRPYSLEEIKLYYEGWLKTIYSCRNYQNNIFQTKCNSSSV